MSNTHHSIFINFNKFTINTIYNKFATFLYSKDFFRTIPLCVIFIIILYVIIYYALRIMYKDVKNGDGKRRRTPNQVKKKTIGIEVVFVSIPGDLKKGSVIPVRNDITIGRKEDNSVVLNDQHVSGNHAILSIRNEALVLFKSSSTKASFLIDNIA